ncbi:hypothetical protein N7540_000018 [Penicillium herquei]|nr:hypothetical protein N7540_000018 [Penicillium herquei]
MTPSSRDLFSQTMTFLDEFYDPNVGYLYDLSSAEGLRHESRQSVFYSLGLLARNKGDDSKNAATILYNIVGGQITDPSSEAYGDYQIYPEQPKFSDGYPAVAYETFYPISRAIMGSALITALEEFPDLLSPHLTNTLKSSLELNLKSNFTPTQAFYDTAYGLSTSFVALWGGENLNLTHAGINVTAQGNELARQVIENYDEYGTIPEFNSVAWLTFTFWPLAMASKYLGDDIELGRRAPDLIGSIWTDLAKWYHADLKNLAAPISRGFGYDLTKYMSSFGLLVWDLVGHGNSPYYLLHPTNPIPRVTDFTNGIMTALFSNNMRQHIPKDAIDNLRKFPGEHCVNGTAYIPTIDYEPQNLTAWLSDNISIGAVSLNEVSAGGPYSESIYIPGAIQWHTGGVNNEVGYINVYPNEASMQIVASPHLMNVSLPNATETSSFQFQVVAFADGHDFNDWDDATGLSVKVTGTAASNFSVGFAGSLGGTGGSAIQEFEFWNVIYAMASDFKAGDIPWIALEVY